MPIQLWNRGIQKARKFALFPVVAFDMIIWLINMIVHTLLLLINHLCFLTDRRHCNYIVLVEYLPLWL